MCLSAGELLYLLCFTVDAYILDFCVCVCVLVVVCVSSSLVQKQVASDPNNVNGGEWPEAQEISRRQGRMGQRTGGDDPLSFIDSLPAVQGSFGHGNHHWSTFLDTFFRHLRSRLC